MNKKTGILFICLGGSFALIGLIMVFSPLNTLGALLAVLGIIFIPIGIHTISGTNVNAIIKEAGLSMPQDGLLVIRERKPAIAKVVRIISVDNLTISYEPEKIHIGSATVGGVTTGGVYKTGGYHYISSAKKSGHYCLEFLGKRINTIQLSDELYNLAITSTIKQFLNEKKQIQIKGDIILSGFDSVLMSAPGETGINNTLKKVAESYPPYDKCLHILNWICGLSQ